MATRRITPPWDFLKNASQPSLESFELSRLNNAANLRREITALIDQWIEDNSQALLARWVRDRRNRPSSEPVFTEEIPQQELPFDNSLTSAPKSSEPNEIVRFSRNAAMSTRSSGRPSNHSRHP